MVDRPRLEFRPAQDEIDSEGVDSSILLLGHSYLIKEAVARAFPDIGYEEFARSFGMGLKLEENERDFVRLPVSFMKDLFLLWGDYSSDKNTFRSDVMVAVAAEANNRAAMVLGCAELVKAFEKAETDEEWWTYGEMCGEGINSLVVGKANEWVDFSEGVEDLSLVVFDFMDRRRNEFSANHNHTDREIDEIQEKLLLMEEGNEVEWSGREQNYLEMARLLSSYERMSRAAIAIRENLERIEGWMGQHAPDDGSWDEDTSILREYLAGV